MYAIDFSDLYCRVCDTVGSFQAYKEIREKCYSQDLGISAHDTGLDVFDAIATTFIIHDQNTVIGGARVIISSNQARNLLPMENRSFSLIQTLHELDLAQKNYCEMSRLAILPEYRSMDTLKCLFQFLSSYAEEHNIHYLFSIAPYAQHRFYRRIFQSIGHKYDIIDGIKAPKHKIYEHLNNVCIAAMPFDKKEVLKTPVISSYQNSKELMHVA